MYSFLAALGNAQLLVGVTAGLVGLPDLYRYCDRPTKGRGVPVPVYADETNVLG